MFDRIRRALKKLIGKAYIDERMLEEFLLEVKRSLIAGDVSTALAREVCESIKRRVEKGFSKREELIRATYEELVKLVGEGMEIEVKKKPFKLMLIGLFGSGKTTTCAKMARLFKRIGYRTCLLGLDTQRPAAQEQLRQLARQVGVDCFAPNEGNALSIASSFLEQEKRYEVIVIDSPGRDALSEEMNEELKKIKEVLKPDHTALVISADLGKAAKEQAKGFAEVGVDSVVLTKMEATAKGGAALVACKETGAKISFIGTGEKIEDLERFDPKSYVSRLLGLGDIRALLEKGKEVVEERKLAERIAEGKFDLIDFYEQIRAVKKIGPLQKLLQLIPGIGMLDLPPELLGMQEEKMRRYEAILQSMTREELENPNVLNASRIRRIARGSGVKEGDVKELLDVYAKIRRMLTSFKRMRGKEMEKLFKRLGIKLPF